MRQSGNREPGACGTVTAATPRTAATAEESKRIIVEEMTAAFVEMFGTEIPVEVEAKVCANWGEK